MPAAWTVAIADATCIAISTLRADENLPFLRYPLRSPFEQYSRAMQTCRKCDIKIKSSGENLVRDIPPTATTTHRVLDVEAKGNDAGMLLDQQPRQAPKFAMILVLCRLVHVGDHL